MKRAGFLSTAAAMLAVGLWGCDGDGGGSGGSGAAGGQGGGGGQGGSATGHPAGDQFCSATSDLFCEALYACCTDHPQGIEDFGNSVEECKEIMGPGCPNGLQKLGLPELLANGQSVLNQARLDACVSTLTAMSAGGAACVEPAFFFYLTDCLSAFEGQIPAGEDCNLATNALSFVACKEGMCAGDYESSHGVCTSYLPSGSSCATPEQDELCNVADGEWCVAVDASATCAPRGEVGAPCGMPDTNTLACRSSVCGSDGTCAPVTTAALCTGD
jgi:hypothetical protein